MQPAIERGSVWSINFTLIEGDPFDPSSSDLIVAQGRLNVGEAIPRGWRVLTGNPTSSAVVAIGYRHELEDLANA
jgi:hypothetical protein